eukprot:354024-Chlamydomonas_euryale.AAC.5
MNDGRTEGCKMLRLRKPESQRGDPARTPPATTTSSRNGKNRTKNGKGKGYKDLTGPQGLWSNRACSKCGHTAACCGCSSPASTSLSAIQVPLSRHRCKSNKSAAEARAPRTEKTTLAYFVLSCRKTGAPQGAGLPEGLVQSAGVVIQKGGNQARVAWYGPYPPPPDQDCPGRVEVRYSTVWPPARCLE